MDEFRIGQLTKELVAAKLRAMDDPCEAAAELIRATISVALGGIPQNSEARLRTITEACKGGMTGLLLREQNIARGAVLVLERIYEVAADCGMDPTVAMEAALQGIADVKRFMVPDRVEELRGAVEQRFMGAGEVLRKYMEQAGPAQAPPLGP